MELFFTVIKINPKLMTESMEEVGSKQLQMKVFGIITILIYIL